MAHDITNEVQHQCPSNSIWWTHLRPSATALALGAAFLATVTAAGSQEQNAPEPPAYKWLYGQGLGIASTAVAAKAAAAQEARAYAADAIPLPNNAGTFITFDAPGAGTGSQQGTFPFAINPAGTIAGFYYDANFVGHGFVRVRNGAITTFDGPNDVGGTYASAINTSGAITGYYCDAIACHGFLRATDGIFTKFDAPGGGVYIFPAGINDSGAITGFYFDTNFMSHGFLRNPNGTITTFDVGTSAFRGTGGDGINARGAIVGCYADSNGISHAFLRASGGAFTTVAPPTRTGDYPDCRSYVISGPAIAINPQGAIASNYFEPIQGNPFGGNYRGFLRTTDGSYETFDAATYPPCCMWTFPLSINPAGMMAGYFNDGYNANHGFVRDSKGNITTLDAPNAGFGGNRGTVANDINPNGTVAGWYIDANSVWHGFLWMP